MNDEVIFLFITVWYWLYLSDSYKKVMIYLTSSKNNESFIMVELKKKSYLRA
jgi:hypothetical protein